MTSEFPPVWTEGVCDDGAAILRDGQMVTISEVLECLNNGEVARLEALEEAAKIAEKTHQGSINLTLVMIAGDIAQAIRDRKGRE